MGGGHGGDGGRMRHGMPLATERMAEGTRDIMTEATDAACPRLVVYDLFVEANGRLHITDTLRKAALAWNNHIEKGGGELHMAGTNRTPTDRRYTTWQYTRRHHQVSGVREGRTQSQALPGGKVVGQ